MNSEDGEQDFMQGTDEQRRAENRGEILRENQVASNPHSKYKAAQKESKLVAH
jgi:hypothetical protein